MHPVSQELNEVLGRLDPETASLLEQTVRDAVKLAGKSATQTTEAKDEMGYPIGYFESTAGSFANEPLERPADLLLESRESW